MHTHIAQGLKLKQNKEDMIPWSSIWLYACLPFLWWSCPHSSSQSVEGCTPPKFCVYPPAHTHAHIKSQLFFSVTKLDAILSVKQAVTPSASDSSVTLHTLLKAVELFLEEWWWGVRLDMMIHNTQVPWAQTFRCRNHKQDEVFPNPWQPNIHFIYNEPYI